MATMTTSWKEYASKKIGNSGGDVWICLEAKYSSQSATANTTYGVQYRAVLAYTGSSYIRDDQASGQCGGTGVSTVSGSGSYFNSGRTTLCTTSAVNIKHNDNGTKGVRGWAYLNFPNWGWSGTASADISLPNIDRSGGTITSQTATPTSATSLRISATSSVDCDLWRYSLDNGAWTDYSKTSGRTGSGTITVAENIYTIKLAGRRTYNQVWGIAANTISVDTRLATVSATIDEPTTDSFSFTATANYDCNLWEYSLNNGSTWVTFSTINAQTASATVSGLAVNTTYALLVRARRTENNLYSRNATYSVKTQGGIMHVNVNGSWKEAIAYVKIGSAWKQAICYTKVGSSWRINT